MGCAYHRLCTTIPLILPEPFLRLRGRYTVHVLRCMVPGRSGGSKPWACGLRSRDIGFFRLDLGLKMPGCGSCCSRFFPGSVEEGSMKAQATPPAKQEMFFPVTTRADDLREVDG